MSTKNQIFRGIPVSGGIVIGKALHVERINIPVNRFNISKAQVNHEIKRFQQAINNLKGKLKRIKDKINSLHLNQKSCIIDAHLIILDDKLLIKNTEEIIKNEHLNAEWALSKNVQQIKKRFENVKDEFFRERLFEIDYIYEQVLISLSGLNSDNFANINKDNIIIAKSLNPIDLLQILKKGIIGLVLEEGSLTAHSTILARSFNVPTIVGVKDVFNKIGNNSVVILNGQRGELIVNPDVEIIKKYSSIQKQYFLILKKFKSNISKPVETVDGVAIHVLGNIDIPEEAEVVIKNYKASGIGLYRTEYLFLNRSVLPDEELQYLSYKQVAESANGKEVVIRTVDIGGDKFLSLKSLPHIEDDLKKLRAIRFSLKHKDFFKVQLKAIMRAASHGNIKILFPFITGVEEILKIKEILEEVKDELKSEGKSFKEDIKIGAMVETPSAALISDILSEHVDFLSIGTNDLIQYTLAAERDNEELSYLYHPSHPAVVRLLTYVVKNSKKEITVCGEMASDILFVPLLIGIGIKKLSVSPHAIPVIKEMIRHINYKEVKKIAEEISLRRNTTEIEKTLEEYSIKNFPHFNMLRSKFFGTSVSST